MINGAGVYSYPAHAALFVLGSATHMAGNATDGDAVAAAIHVAARAGHGPDLHMPVKGVQGRGAGSLSNHTGAVGAGADLNEAGDLAVPDYHPHSMVGDAFDAAHRCDSATDGIPEFSTPGKRGIGVLASGTGPPSKLAGIPAGRAVGLAACNYNPDLANEGADWRLETIKKDDRAHPQAALDTMQEYRSDGIAALAGPVSGGSASAILDHVSNNGMVAISHG